MEVNENYQALLPNGHDQVGIPSRPPPIGLSLHMGEQCRPARIAMVVERKLVTNDQNVIPGITFRGTNPNWSESAIGISLDERICQDVAGAARKEDPFG